MQSLIPAVAGEAEQSAGAWWAHRRRNYNQTLISSAPWSCIGVLMVWLVFGFRLPCLDVTFFTIFITALLLIATLPLANLYYNFGPVAEERARPPKPSPSPSTMMRSTFCRQCAPMSGSHSEGSS